MNIDLNIGGDNPTGSRAAGSEDQGPLVIPVSIFIGVARGRVSITGAIPPAYAKIVASRILSVADQASGTPHSPERFHTRMHRLRRACGMGQEELGRKLGVSRSAIAQWETDRAKPTHKHLVQIADALGVPPSVLMEG